MTTSIEETGRTIEEATDKALEKLGVSEEEVDVEILEEGARGFLGIGQAPTKVRVSLKATSVKEAVKVKPVSEKPKKIEKQKKEIMEKPVEEPKAPEIQSMDHVAEIAKEVLQKIVDGLNHDGTAEVVNVSDNQVELNVEGGDTARLIGRHAQTPDSIQYLVAVITNKRADTRARIIVDAEGYRSRRTASLEQRAVELAKKVKESGQEAVLDSLQSHERRVIHTALVDDPNVYTYSEGEEPNRQLVISPKK